MNGRFEYEVWGTAFGQVQDRVIASLEHFQEQTPAQVWAWAKEYVQDKYGPNATIKKVVQVVRVEVPCT